MKLEIKICGLTNVDDARCALDAGADYLGFVLYPRSPRGIDAARLRGILDRLDRPVRAVAVVVNEPRAGLESVASDCGLWAVQLHGDERPEDFRDCPFRVWRAVRGAEPAGWTADRYVVDAAVPGLYGGTSVRADWGMAAEMARRLPLLLAGGLNADNVKSAVKAVCPLGVDVSSGVEKAPGIKDHDAIRAFVRRAGSAAGD